MAPQMPRRRRQLGGSWRQAVHLHAGSAEPRQVDPNLERDRAIARGVQAPDQERFRPLAKRLTIVLQTINTLLRFEPLLIGLALALALALAAWGCEALAFNVLVQRLPQEVPLIAPFAIVGLSAAIGALSMLPGGVGGVEAVMLLLLASSALICLRQPFWQPRCHRRAMITSSLSTRGGAQVLPASASERGLISASDLASGSFVAPRPSPPRRPTRRRCPDAVDKARSGPTRPLRIAASMGTSATAAFDPRTTQ
jgi:lysylphosphatidylglycerol synthase-like protein